jgi:hypothetical protein
MKWIEKGSLILQVRQHVLVKFHFSQGRWRLLMVPVTDHRYKEEGIKNIELVNNLI